MSYQMLITPVILCGGSGTRLWPASRKSYPKQFLPLVGDESTFQATVRRVTGDTFARPVVITGDAYRFLVAQQLDEIGIEADILIEPEGRDSGPAVLAGAVWVAGKAKKSVCLVLAADHVIPDTQAFVADARRAGQAAQDGHIVTFGIKPTHPATGYGYIDRGDTIDTNVTRVKAFVEKPDAAAAEKYIKDGYVWNSGNFCFRADTLIEEARTLTPDMLKIVQASVDATKSDMMFERLDAGYAQAAKISFDYAIMEPTNKAAVLEASFEWSDVGTWDSLWDISPRDENGMVCRGPVSTIDSRNSLVFSDPEILTTAVGIDDMVVVSTLDSVLVLPRTRAGDMKDLLAQLTREGRSEAHTHTRVHRPWGSYQTIDKGDRFQVKRIMVTPGQRLSLQRHHHRAEHWTIVRGTALVTIDAEEKMLTENESVYIPLGAIHRLENPGKINLELIEVQTGSYTGEDDIVRYEDVYNRAPQA